MKKKKVFKFLYKLIILIFIILFAYSLYHIFIWKNDNNKNKVIKENLEKYITRDKDEKYNIDFDKLKEKNNDTVGYIKVYGTNIDYIVVKANDNSYYLNHNFNKEKNISGWIFADYENKLDGTDKNLIIYGHNTADDSMFGSLKNILSEDWYLNKNNHKVLYIDEKGSYIYEVFSIYKIDNEEYYLKKIFNTDNDFNDFIKKIKDRSIYDFGINVDENDNILTLSSCANLGKKRVVLHARKIK